MQYFRIHKHCMVTQLAGVDDLVYQHADCLLSLSKNPYHCGPPTFCHDCLQVGVAYEQRIVYQKIMSKIRRADGSLLIGNMPYSVLQKLTNGNQYNIKHEVIYFQNVLNNIYYFYV